MFFLKRSTRVPSIETDAVRFLCNINRLQAHEPMARLMHVISV